MKNEYTLLFKTAMQDLDGRLSRTAKGNIDSSVSEKKRVTSKTNPIELVNQNREKVCEYIFDTNHKTLNQNLFEEIVSSIASLTLTGFEIPIYRDWPSPYSQSSRLKPQDLKQELSRYYEQITNQLQKGTNSIAPNIASLAEFKLNIDIHPFYDGCSRISRYIGHWILARFKRLPPLIEEKEIYWATLNKGFSEFEKLYTEGVKKRETLTGWEVKS